MTRADEWALVSRLHLERVVLLPDGYCGCDIADDGSTFFSMCPAMLMALDEVRRRKDKEPSPPSAMGIAGRWRQSPPTLETADA